jgi:hemolysin III
MEATAKGAKTRARNQKHNAFFYSKGEEIFNAVSHIVGGAFGLAAWIVLTVLAAPDIAAVTAVSVFSASIVLLYTMSALYHFLPAGRAKAVFRIFDHCTIFLLIAGTYTPFCVIALGGTTVGAVILLVEWFCALLGVTMNAIAMKNKAVKGISMALYVVMGWLIIAGAGALVKSLPAASLWLLLAGGLAYTGGIVFFALGKKVPYFHSVWHLFDLAGTALQFASIVLMLL